MAIQQAPNPWPQTPSGWRQASDRVPDTARYGWPQPAGEPRPSRDPSLGELFGAFNGEMKTLVENELHLAKAEMKQQVATATKAGAMFGAAAVAGLLMLLLASFAAAWGLAEVVPTGVAFLIMAVVYLIVAGVCLSMARSRMRRFQPVPEQALANLRRDVQVAKDSLTRGMHSPLGNSSWRRS